MNVNGTQALTVPRRSTRLAGSALTRLFQEGSAGRRTPPALDPIFDTQAIFRAVLDAFARPGLLKRLPVGAAGAPGNPWAVGVLLTLLDRDTPFAVRGDQQESLETFIRTRTDAPPTTVEGASWVLADLATVEVDPLLARRLRVGTPDYPDEGATLVVTLANLFTVDEGPRVSMTGPGIQRHITARLGGLPDAFLAARTEVVGAFPLGFDLLLIDDEGRVMGIPRSTRVSPAHRAGLGQSNGR